LQEFDAWMVEVKKISPDAIGKLDAKKFFVEYMEDYNTATLPHPKYYNMDAWLEQERARAAKKEAKKHAREHESAPPAINLLADEERLRYAAASMCLPLSVSLCVRMLVHLSLSLFVCGRGD
jgi:hypothetical protein